MSLSMFIWRTKVEIMAFSDCYAVALNFLQIRICDYSFYLNNV